MKTFPVTLLFLITLIFVINTSVIAQEVRNTSYTTKSGEKALRIETVVSASTQEVWDAFTTPAGITGWIAPVAKLDLRVGGTLSTHYDKKAVIGDPGTIRLQIINYLEGELITFKVNLNESFAKSLQEEDDNLQEIVQIVSLGKGRTKIISTMIGWGTGKDWDDAYKFFVKGNEWSYKGLMKYLSRRAN
jgi:uncharacterized protein YndB with AHSA1/START domain